MSQPTDPAAVADLPSQVAGIRLELTAFKKAQDATNAEQAAALQALRSEASTFKAEADGFFSQANAMSATYNLIKFEPMAMLNLTDLLGDPGKWLHQQFYSRVLNRATPEEVAERALTRRFTEVGNEASRAKMTADYALKRANEGYEHSRATRRYAAQRNMQTRTEVSAVRTTAGDAEASARTSATTLANLRAAANAAGVSVTDLQTRIDRLVGAL